MPDLRASMAGLTGDLEQDVKNLSNYVFQLTEEIRYLLNNLDVTNFNDLGLARYENGRLQFYSEAIDAKAQTIRADVEKSFELVVGADGKITPASIVAAINGSGSFVKISADHLEFEGSAEFITAGDLSSTGSTIIDGGRIQTGEIRAVNFIAQPGGYGYDETSFKIQNASDTEVGGIKYLRETEWLNSYQYQILDKMYLFTSEYYSATGWMYPAIKLKSAGRVSIEAGSGGSANHQMLFMRGDPVLIESGGYQWEFNSSGEFKRR